MCRAASAGRGPLRIFNTGVLNEDKGYTTSIAMVEFGAQAARQTLPGRPQEHAALHLRGGGSWLTRAEPGAGRLVAVDVARRWLRLLLDFVCASWRNPRSPEGTGAGSSSAYSGVGERGRRRAVRRHRPPSVSSQRRPPFRLYVKRLPISIQPAPAA